MLIEKKRSSSAMLLGSLICFSTLLVVACQQPTEEQLRPGYTQWESAGPSAPLAEASENVLARGAALYDQRCLTCHGREGDGQGAASVFLEVAPRDFRRGLYKFRTSPSGEIPRDADLFRSITAGFPAYGMPSFAYLSENDRWALVHYVKSFAQVFERGEALEAMELGEPPLPSAELLEQGQVVFEKARCGQCHGQDGRGFGPSAEGLEDSWGHPIPTLNLTSATIYWKTGSRPRDIMRTLTTGLNGTPMPSYLESGFTKDELWSLAFYIASLADEDERDATVASGRRR